MRGASVLQRLLPARGVFMALGAVLAMAMFVSGCSTTTSERRSAFGSSGSTGDGSRLNGSGDLVTASDEPANLKRARVRFELASAYYGRGQLAVALDEVKLALAADPTLAEAQNLRGLIYAGLNDVPLAEESFKRALQLSPRDPDTMHNYAWFMCQEKRYDEADAMFERALQIPLYRGVTGTLRARGVCQARAGHLAQAEQSLTRSYDLDPGNPATAVNLSEILLRRGAALERARFYMQRVNSNPQIANAQTLWLAARIEARLGNMRGATEFGYQVQSRYPGSPEARAFEQRRFDE